MSTRVEEMTVGVLAVSALKQENASLRSREKALEGVVAELLRVCDESDAVNMSGPTVTAARKLLTESKNDQATTSGERSTSVSVEQTQPPPFAVGNEVIATVKGQITHIFDKWCWLRTSDGLPIYVPLALIRPLTESENDQMTTDMNQANIQKRDGACSGAPSHTLNLTRRFSMSDDQRTSAPADDKILGCFTSQELVDVLRQLEELHDKYDFHFTIYRFSTHWKVSLHTPEHSNKGRLLLWKLLPGSDLVTAIKVAIGNKQGEYRSEISQKIWEMDEDQALQALGEDLERHRRNAKIKAKLQ